MNMRKWMRDRLQRRKKASSDKGNQPAPPPLQPAYFDAEQAHSTPEQDQPEDQPLTAAHEPAEEPAEAYEAESAPQSAQGEPNAEAAKRPRQSRQKQSSGSGDGKSARGRRRRGGRGRGGRGREQAVAQAFAPAAGKGTIPEVGADAADANDAAEGNAAELSELPAEASAEVAEPEAEAAAPAPQAPEIPAAVPLAPPRPPKGIVVLAIGLPGSGKSSWFKRHNLTPLSSDLLRALLFDDVREQRFQDLVFSNLRSMLKARLIAKRPMNYVDATNLTPQERQHWIKLAKDYNYEVHAVFFDVPLEVCIERHQRRDRVVPEDAMRRMAAKLKPPSFDEGFAKITVVRVKKKE
jgi:predicted kinase